MIHGSSPSRGVGLPPGDVPVQAGKPYPEAGESFSRPIDTLAQRKDTHRLSCAGWGSVSAGVRHTPCTAIRAPRFAMNRQRSPAWRFIWKKTALKDQIMNDPGSAREFQSVTREPLPPSSQASSEEALSEIKSAVLAKLVLAVGKDAGSATDRDWFLAAAFAIRDRIIHRWLASERASNAKGSKRVYYLSLEFLIGRLWSDVLCNLDLGDVFRAALGDLGVDLNRLRAAEPDAALGNGGLGRLAACFMESMATLEIPAYGYGIRYDHGLFRQVIRDGRQQEYPEEWLSFGNPWEFARPEVIHDIQFGGSVETTVSPTGLKRSVWHPAETIEAVAYDIPIVGWRGRHVNPLRLWSARAVDPMRLDAFNMGDHVGALSEQTRAEAISKILYPSDSTPAGQELRLRQEYFFVSASLLDLVQRHLKTDGNLYLLPLLCAIQLNDTHPSIAIPELMRILVDLHGLPWDEAWRICVETLSYTNHTLLPEAHERWSL